MIPDSNNILFENLDGFSRDNHVYEPETNSDMEALVTRTSTPLEDTNGVEWNQIRSPVRPHAIVPFNVVDEFLNGSQLETAGIEPA